MTRYIVKRLLQGIPLLFFVSLVLFALMMNLGDPVSTMGGRRVTRRTDYERLRRQLGLDQPIVMQYVFWLVVIYPEGVWCWVGTEADVTEIMERHVIKGEIVTRLLMPDHPAPDSLASLKKP